MVARSIPLTDSFTAAWRAFGAPKRLLLAVSGGSDSIALLNLASPLRREGAEILVATVDHGLRQASADDARFALRAAEERAIPARLLRWDGAKPETGVQAAARAARYRLIAQEAERWRADAILTAHTADDQAETVLMRMTRRPGVRGLAGMAPETFIADGAHRPHRLLRPLLGHRRAALRSFLMEIGAAYIDDPSNDDVRFERVRARRVLAFSPGGVVATDALLALAADARRLTALLDRLDNSRLNALGARFLADGSVRLSALTLAPARDGPLVARLLAAAGGGETPAEDAVAAALLDALAGRQTTLAGALIGRAGSDLFLMREPAAVLGRTDEQAMAPVPLAPGARRLWDRRFLVENTLGAPAVIRPVGDAARALKGGCWEALATAPGLWTGSSLAAFPGDDGPGDAAFAALTAERFHRRVVRH